MNSGIMTELERLQVLVFTSAVKTLELKRKRCSKDIRVYFTALYCALVHGLNLKLPGFAAYHIVLTFNISSVSDRNYSSDPQSF